MFGNLAQVGWKWFLSPACNTCNKAKPQQLTQNSKINIDQGSFLTSLVFVELLLFATTLERSSRYLWNFYFWKEVHLAGYEPLTVRALHPVFLVVISLAIRPALVAHVLACMNKLKLQQQISRIFKSLFNEFWFELTVQEDWALCALETPADWSFSLCV